MWIEAAGTHFDGRIVVGKDLLELEDPMRLLPKSLQPGIVVQKDETVRTQLSPAAGAPFPSVPNNP
jgi:hypothetical protein